MKKRNPFIAAFLSLITPGLGSFYNSSNNLFYLFFISFIFFNYLITINNIYVFLAGIFLGILLWIFSILHSFFQARKIKEIELGKLKKFYIYLIPIIIVFTSNIYFSSNTKFTSFHIPAKSMQPTLLVGDYVFFDKNYYLKNEVKYGDLVVFKTKDNVDFVKRVIGMPGDNVQISEGKILLNNVLIKKIKTDDFIEEDMLGNIERTRKYKEKLFNVEYEVLDLMDNGIVDNTNIYSVPEGHYFVMGDNRDNSLDSRFIDKIGFVPEDKILHRANFIYWAKDKSRIASFLN